MRKCYKRVFIQNPIHSVPIFYKEESDRPIKGYYLYIWKCKRYFCFLLCCPFCVQQSLYMFQEPIYE